MHPEDIISRFWPKVDRSGSCWEWQASRVNGYGQFTVNRRIVLAHRFAWEITNGPIPNGLFVCHHCDNRLCVNPSHLFLGSAADNSGDMVAKNRVRHGAAHRNTKLTDKDVHEIRSLKGSMTYKALAQQYGISTTTAWRIAHGESWRRT